MGRGPCNDAWCLSHHPPTRDHTLPKFNEFAPEKLPKPNRQVMCLPADSNFLGANVETAGGVYIDVLVTTLQLGNRWPKQLD